MEELPERFRAKFQVMPNGCWEWTAARNNKGYGQFWYGGRNVLAHQFAYELLISPVPEEMELDHACRNHACVNPAHLEVVTHQENCQRGELGAPKKQLCPKGHPYDEVNTYVDPRGKRNCRICQREACRRWRQRKKQVEKSYGKERG